MILIPIGATEQHGKHLPLMVDTGWSIAVAEQVARKAGLLAAPPLHFGWSPHHLAFPGSITLRPETLTQVIIDVCQSLMTHGFKKFVLVNGNRVANLAPMEIAANRLRLEHNAFVTIVDVGLIARREIDQICGGAERAQSHAGDSETSFMLHYYGDLVDMANVEWSGTIRNSQTAFTTIPTSVEPPHDRNAVLFRMTLDEYRTASDPSGVGGDPRFASAEKGGRILEAIVANTVAYINEIRALPVQLRSVSVPS
jgi:creatinine amidohydrolase